MNVHLTVQVPRSPALNQVIDRLTHKLEPLLLAFQPELVQLQGRLVRHTSREGVLCRLNLHLPTGQLSGERISPTAQTAFRGASEELLRQLNKHKERLRETRPRWKPERTRHRAAVEAGVLVPATVTSQDLEARQRDLAGYFGGYYQHLLAFIRRQLHLRERLGEIPSGLLDPQEVLDEVVVEALSETPAQAAQNRGRWLLLLAAGAIRRLAKSYGDHPHGQEMKSLDQADGARVPDGWGDDAEDAEPPPLSEFVAAAGATPEDLAANREAMDRLALALRDLPPRPRHDLVLYLLEGFRPEELAAISQRPVEEVMASINEAESALRRRGDLPAIITRRLRPVASEPRIPLRTQQA